MNVLMAQFKSFRMLSKLTPLNAKRFSSSIKGMALTYVVGAFLLDLTKLFDVSYSGQKIILGIAGIFFLNFIFLMILALLHPIRSTLMHSRFLLAQAIGPFWWLLASSGFIIVYVLWLFDEVDLSEALGPLVLTLILVPSMRWLVRFVRRMRLTYLWNKRKILRSTPTYGMLKSRSFVSKLTSFFIYSAGCWILTIVWDIRIFKPLKEALGAKFFQHGADILVLGLLGYFLVHGGDKILRYYLEAKQKESPAEGSFALARFKTITRIMRTALRIAVWTPIILVIISANHDKVMPVVTSFGIVAVGMTVALQTFIRDFVNSFLMILENTLMVGDQIDIDGKTGIVEDLSLRTLKVRADNGMLLTIPFNQIGVVGNKSRAFSCVVCNISVAYGENVERIQQLVERAFQTLKKTPAYARKIVAPLEIRGVNEVTDFSMIFQVRLRTAPSQQDFVRRGFNRVLKQVFDESNVQVPTPSYSLMEKNPSLTNTSV